MLCVGQVHEDDVELLQSADETPVSANTNFTSGAHFYEQVEDAKDSVWLVQVLAKRYNHNHIHTLPLPELTWKSLRKKVTKFGVHTGVLDCALDPWYVHLNSASSAITNILLQSRSSLKPSVTRHLLYIESKVWVWEREWPIDRRYVLGKCQVWVLNVKLACTSISLSGWNVSLFPCLINIKDWVLDYFFVLTYWERS